VAISVVLTSSRQIARLCAPKMPRPYGSLALVDPLDANYWRQGRSGSFRQVGHSLRFR